MALRKSDPSGINIAHIELISSADEHVDLDKSDYEKYIDTLDQKHLTLTGKPSILLLNLDFKGREAKALKNAMMSSRDDDGKPAVSIGSYSFMIARFGLKDIQHPDGVADGIKFKKGKDGNVDEDLLGELDRQGILAEIMTVYTTHVQRPNRAAAKN